MTGITQSFCGRDKKEVEVAILLDDKAVVVGTTDSRWDTVRYSVH